MLLLLSLALIGCSQLGSTVEVVAMGKCAAPAAAADKKKDLSLKLDSISSPIKAGSDAKAAITTEPNAMCDITVKYKSGPASAAGLKAQRADKDGKCTWTWKVAKNTAVGEWPVDIKASLKGAKATTSTTLKVEK
jgi:hypothetical protein